jgi:predicted  nucleic acid-binding Zn-ribbon protein
VKADPEAQLRLLDVQALDATVDRLAHRRRTLPDAALADELATRVRALDDEIVSARTEDRDLERDQRKVEAEVDLVRGRGGRDRQRLEVGQVSSPRELESLQSEVASLKRRQEALEDDVLAVMERREEVQARIAAAERTRAAAAADRQAAEDRRDAAYREIDAETAEAARHRAELAGGLPADLLALYERIRAGSGGVGAAALHRGRCQGCHLQLTTADLVRLRDAPADEVLRCEECRRILVRTPESGL